MKIIFAVLCAAVALSGCGNSDEVKANTSAQTVVDEVRASWDSIMPFEPGHRQTGIVSMNKEFVVGCSTKMSEAADKLSALKTEYVNTDVSKSDSTAVLQKDVIRWANTCNEIKSKQGW